METIKVTVKDVNLFQRVNSKGQTFIMVRIDLNEMIPGQEIEKGTVVKKDVDFFNIPLQTLNVELTNAYPNIKYWRAEKDRGMLGQVELRKLFMNTQTLEITNQEIVSGELYEVDGEERAAKNDFFKVDVVGIALNATAKRIIDEKAEVW